MIAIWESLILALGSHDSGAESKISFIVQYNLFSNPPMLIKISISSYIDLTDLIMT